MSELKLYRKRYIPRETIQLKDDVIVSHTEDVLITTWKTLNPKSAFSHGASCYFFKEGFKLSKFYRHDDSLLYYYCDIVEYINDTTTNSLTSVDLLADVVIYPDGSVKVLDLDELADAYKQSLITETQLTDALYKLNHLLQIIQAGTFDKYADRLNSLNI